MKFLFDMNNDAYEPLASRMRPKTLEEFVVYRPLYGDRGLWVRPLRMFTETVERDGKRQPRFVYVGQEQL